MLFKENIHNIKNNVRKRCYRCFRKKHKNK